MLLATSGKEPTMKDTRTVRRSFVRRLEADQQWNQLYRLLLEIGSTPTAYEPAAEEAAAAPSQRTEVPHERCRLCPGLDPTSSRGTDD
jgi:hypothetical protein